MALMTRLAVVRSGAGCLGRHAASSSRGGASGISMRSALATSPSSSSSATALRAALRKGAVTLSRAKTEVVTRAASTAAGEPTTATTPPNTPAPFKRHERIASIKVRRGCMDFRQKLFQRFFSRRANNDFLAPPVFVLPRPVNGLHKIA